tara:strand:+ start:239 stop:466 length:228 start_codon:yes stop_codon:yes gene_type:complete
MDKEYDFMGYQSETVERAVEEYGKGNIKAAVFNMEAKIASLQVESDSLREMVDWDKLSDDDEENRHTHRTDDEDY